MRIIHKIMISESDPETLTLFKKSGISFKTIGDVCLFQIEEGNPHWLLVSKLIKTFKPFHTVRTEFSAAELKNAKFLRMSPSWHHGYPQPQDNAGYLALTYNLAGYCNKCGMQPIQIAPFRMRKEPVWGKRSILQLNWVFDEYFVKPVVWEKVFKPMGIGYKTVLHHKTGKVLESVIQLEVSEHIDIIHNDAEYEQCTLCGRRKYLPITSGFYPPPIQMPSSAIFKTNQYFGSGASAYSDVLVSNSLYLAIKEENLKGAEFEACAQ